MFCEAATPKNFSSILLQPLQIDYLCSLKAEEEATRQLLLQVRNHFNHENFVLTFSVWKTEIHHAWDFGRTQLVYFLDDQNLYNNISR